MGEMADDARNAYELSELEYEIAVNHASWAGTSIAKLSDAHLLNLHALFLKKAAVNKAQLEDIGWSLLTTLRGEHALENIESTLDDLLFMDIEDFLSQLGHPVYEAVIREISRRELKPHSVFTYTGTGWDDVR